MPSCLVIQHVEPERPYAISDALDVTGTDVIVRRVDANDFLPQRIGDFDGLVIMGGPMSATSDEGFLTRERELDLLAQALDLGLPTLGVCLGAQLLAIAAGGRVLAGPTGPEIGWAPVRLRSAAASDPLFSIAPAELQVLHWHGDTYELPPGAVHLASSISYPHQAFRVGDSAWGLQFHIEVDEAAVDAFLRKFGHEVLAAGTTPETIRKATPGALSELRPHRDALLGRFAALVGSRRSSIPSVD
jgi:GMP synthase-like glutamine amidotransferase